MRNSSQLNSLTKMSSFLVSDSQSVCMCVYMYLLTQNSSYEYLPYFKFNVHHNGIEEYDFSIVVDFLFFFFVFEEGEDFIVGLRGRKLLDGWLTG